MASLGKTREGTCAEKRTETVNKMRHSTLTWPFALFALFTGVKDGRLTFQPHHHRIDPREDKRSINWTANREGAMMMGRGW